jgi:hypothetical protein
MSQVQEQPQDRRRRRTWWLACLVVMLVAGGWQLAGDAGSGSKVLGAGAGKSAPPSSGPGTEVLASQASRSLLEPPVITFGPTEGSSSGPTVSFTYSHPQNGVNFACSLDNAPVTRCPRSGITYTGLAAGPHFFAVAAQQGNGPLSAPASVNWSVGPPGPSAPPAPVITSGPPSSAIDPDAIFTFSNSRSGVDFECRLDSSGFSACDSPQSYVDLEVGSHTFFVRAVDSTGTSPVATYPWTIVKAGFGISGDVDGPLAPGVTRPLNLAFTNPFSNAHGIDLTDIQITVNDVTIKDGRPNPDCVGSDNLTVERGSAWAINVPRKSTVSLEGLGIDPDLWPQVTMLNLDENQDACKNTTFAFSYTGSAEKS